MRPFPAVVDHLAGTEPNRVWLKIPEYHDGDMSWRDVTFRQFGQAVNTMAHWMDLHLGKAHRTKHDQPVAYVGINDIRHPIIILAALKTGQKALLTSPRNSIEGHLNLLNSTNCAKLLFSKEFKGLAGELSSKSETLLTVQVPELDEILRHGPSSEPYYSKLGTDVSDDETLMILHSSGSTGLPKPIVQKAGVWRVVDGIMSTPAPAGRRFVHDELYGTRLVVVATPFFHCYGINLLTRSIYHAGPIVLLPPDRPTTADLMLQAVAATKPSAMACPPSILEDICAVPGGVEALSSLDFIFYGGAPIAKPCGDKIARVARLVNGTGTTEMYMASLYLPLDPGDWHYFEWDPMSGITMEPTDDPNLFEMVVKRGPDAHHQFVFFNYPELQEWRTKDLFERHPTKPDLWKSVGRIDDVLVLSNGEKINPVSFEKVLEGHPWVRGAMVVGAGQFQTGLILEPQPGLAVSGTEEFVQHVWPSVEQANAQYPAHGRVWRSMIMLASPEKPFHRAPKGSVVRRATTQLYEQEIRALYSKNDATAQGGAGEVAPRSLTQTENLIRQAVKSVLGAPSLLTNQTNLFTLGMDSLQVLQLSQILSRSMHHLGTKKASRLSCSPRVIYANPTIASLAQALVLPIPPCQPAISREEKMSRLIHKYTRSPSRSVATSRHRPLPSSNLTVILTGSTGSLGTHLLHKLLLSPAVSCIHCLNRAPDAASRQAAQLSSIASCKLPLPQKTTFHTADLSKPGFGLAGGVYEDLVDSAHVFIHNAWPVDFNKGLEEFEGAVEGVARIAEFARASRQGTRIVFVSSVASATNWAAVRGDRGAETMDWDRFSTGSTDVAGCSSANGEDSTAVNATTNGCGHGGEERELVVPEEFEEDNSLPAKQGYGESKHVASCILARTARRWGLDVTLLRAGQLAGPKEGDGVWGRHEWLPSLIATSKTLGKIPSSLGGRHGTVDWVPVDIAAQVTLELALSRPSHRLGEVACYNLVNPHSVPWDELVKAVQQFYVLRGGVMELVAMEDWVQAVQEVGASNGDSDVGRYPALRLVDFFQGLVSRDHGAGCKFGTELAVERSPTMAKLGPVDGNLMKRWLEGWAF